MATKKSHQDLESALKELEKLVTDMETGKLSLDESLKHFERGVALTKQCQKILSDAEQKVKILTDDQQLKTFNGNND
ncbi:MAG: exodeoxyribonuclease VII small subunit [Pseudomonadota bacterium]